VSDYDTHLSSYDHHHRKRLKDLKTLASRHKSGWWLWSRCTVCLDNGLLHRQQAAKRGAKAAEGKGKAGYRAAIEQATISCIEFDRTYREFFD
jgi:hypothetical protein